MSDKAFLKLPRVLITEPLRSKLSDSAIVLYSYLISLYELSVRNGERFRDENGRYYVVSHQHCYAAAQLLQQQSGKRVYAA